MRVLLKGLNNQVIIRLKNNTEYKGRMVKCDDYMNIILVGATEREEKTVVKYGKILIRGSSVLFVCLDSDR